MSMLLLVVVMVVLFFLLLLVVVLFVVVSLPLLIKYLKLMHTLVVDLFFFAQEKKERIRNSEFRAREFFKESLPRGGRGMLGVGGRRVVGIFCKKKHH